MSQLTQPEWEHFCAQQPGCHLLQSSAWANLKQPFGWTATWIQVGACGAQILFRKLPLGMSIAYIPKGPLGPTSGWAALWQAVDRVCQARRAVFALVEPDALEPAAEELMIQMRSFGSPVNPIQPRRTLLVDLRGTEENWLARMSKKTRHCFKYAEQNGVRAEYSEDIDGFIRLMQQTGQRAQFGVHSSAYYQRAYALFAPTQSCALIMARRDERNLAGLLIFRQAERAYYLYGASSGEDRQYNPTYLIQLESMRWAAAHGCMTYDLWGVPDTDLDTLEAQFTTRNDGLWGVYGYKRKFGGELVRSVGAWRRVYNPLMFAAYRLLRPASGSETA